MKPDNVRPHAFRARLQYQTPHIRPTMSDPTLFLGHYNIRPRQCQIPSLRTGSLRSKRPRATRTKFGPGEKWGERTQGRRTYKELCTLANRLPVHFALRNFFRLHLEPRPVRSRAIRPPRFSRKTAKTKRTAERFLSPRTTLR